MKNELFSIGPFTIYGYGLMIAIGFCSAYLACEFRAKKQKLDPELLFGILVCSLVGGLAGAKVLYWITRWKDILENPKILLDIADGFVVYGGIIGGVLVAALYLLKKKAPFWRYFDLVMPSVALAQGFGRLGCFLSGCCYGKETDSWIGMAFHDSQYAPNGVDLIPTQLISSGLNFLNFVILVLLTKHRKGDGQIGALYLIFYSVGRFLMEYFRGDLIRGTVGSVTTSQFISIFMFIIGVVLLVIRNGKFQPDQETVKAEAQNM